MLRFAEKMLLNSTIYGLVPYATNDAQGNRCAIGLVGFVVNNAEERDNAQKDYAWAFATQITYPCNCKYYHDTIDRPINIIIHLFNEHVMKGIRGGGAHSPKANKWSLEQLADWIDSVDPTPRPTITDAIAILSDGDSVAKEAVHA